MNDQPEALRLADALDDLMGEETLIGAVHIDKASYELRRLHAENERLREGVKAEREACAKICETGADCEHPTVKGYVMQNFGASTHLAAAIRARGET